MAVTLASSSPRNGAAGRAIDHAREAIAQVRGWGWAFAFGAACLALAAALAARVPAMRREGDALATAADLAEHRARALRSHGHREAAAPPGPVRFLQDFPAADTRQERLAALFGLAAERHLRLRAVELKLAPERELGLQAYTVVMPLSGSYAQLRDFIAAAQALDPAASLDHLRLRRASPAAPMVEADLAWTLYMRPPVLPGSPR